ncbi:MAG TPA: hypothetical protein VF915_17085 [Reyranella sp.]
MQSFTGLAVLAAMLCGGAWGWRVGTKRLHRRSIFDGDEDRGAPGWRRRVRQRYWTTAVYAVLSALTVLVVMMAIRR